MFERTRRSPASAGSKKADETTFRMILQPKLSFAIAAAGAFGPKEENPCPDPQIIPTTPQQAGDCLQRAGHLKNSGINPFDNCYPNSSQRALAGPDTQQPIDQTGAFWVSGKAATAEG
jgi:hypothetical protein